MWAWWTTTVVLGVVGWHWRRRGLPLFEYLACGWGELYARLWHRWSSNGLAPLPAQGPALLISNHTCSPDPTFVTAGSRRTLRFLVAVEFYRLAPLAWLFRTMGCVPVKRDGHDVLALRLSLRRLREGDVVCIFPEGGVHNAGRPRPGRARAGAAWLALRSRAPVYPAFIAGGPQTLHLRTAWLGRSRVRVIYGPAIDLSAYYDQPLTRRLLDEVTELLMQRITDLRHMSGKAPTLRGPSARRTP